MATSGSPVRKKTVVFVDDNAGFLEVLCGQMFERYQDRYSVETCSSPAALLKLIQSREIDLVCLDLAMPVMDGFQTLKLIRKVRPNLQIMILTSKDVDEKHRKEIERGASLFLQKPQSANDYDSLFAGIQTLLDSGQKSSFQVSLSEFSLPELIQMKCTRQATNLCEIDSGNATGSIYIEGGKVIHAEMGEMTGFEAFWHMVALNEGTLQAKKFVEPPQRTIEDRWEHLLLESARMIDESTPVTSDSDASGTVPSSVHIFPPDDLIISSRSHGAMLRSINDGRAVTLNILLLTETSIVNEPYGKGWTPLMIAAWKGHLDVVKALIKGGAKVEMQTDEGFTALIMAAHKGHATVTSTLLAHGANPNAMDKDSRTVLMWAAQSGCLLIVRDLFSHHVDLNLRDKKGMTALDYARHGGHEEIIPLLQNTTEEISPV